METTENSKGAADQTGQELNKRITKNMEIALNGLSELMEKIKALAFFGEFIKDPEAALSSYILKDAEHLEEEPLNKSLFDALQKAEYDHIISSAAEILGVDPEQLKDPDRRTPEQKKLFTELFVLYNKKRMDLYQKSRFLQTMKYVNDFEQKSNYKGAEGDLDLREITALLFLSAHDIDPADTKPLTKAHKKELEELFEKLDQFCIDNPEAAHLDIFSYFAELNFSEKKELPSIITKKIKDISYPLDKANSSLWKLTPGIKAELKAESDRDRKKGKEATTYLLFDFDDIEGASVTLSRPLTIYDKKVFLAAANLKDRGLDVVTTAQIHAAMGNRGRPNPTQRKRIINSIEIMARCRVTLDNSEEAALYKRYDTIKHTFYLLPTERGEGYINGLLVDDAIFIKELPQLFVFAKKRNQITRVPIALLESPISQTEENMQLEDYLFTRIARMKNAQKRHKPASHTILFETIFTSCGISDRVKKHRAKEKIERVLTHYQKNGHIKDFTLAEKSIDIHL